MALYVKAKQHHPTDQGDDRIGRKRSKFMLEATCREVEDILLVQSFFVTTQPAQANQEESIELIL